MSGDSKDYELHDDQLQYLAEQARRATASDVAVIVVRNDRHTSTGITAGKVSPGRVGQAHAIAEALMMLLGSCQTILDTSSGGHARLVLEVDGRRVPMEAGEILHRTVRMTPADGS